jgi:putative sugar O-methyltransferase
MLSSLKRRVRQALSPPQSSPAVLPPTYYVTKYAREDYGTEEQLEAGYRDNAHSEPTPPDVLDRLIGAWRAMQGEAQRIPPAYQVGGEWKTIIGQAFQPLTSALDAGDHATLDDLLRNFFRSLGDFFGEPTDLRSESIKQARREQFRLYASRWIDLYGAELTDVHLPVICNPIGFRVQGAFITADSFRHNFYARRMADLADDIPHPIVCEVGGGFGGFAYHLLRRPGPAFKYLNYDLPVMCIVSAFYLLNSCRDRDLRLFGELNSLTEPVRDGDIAILPNFLLPSLADQSVDICFNTCSFAEMDATTVQEYTAQFERVCRKFILYADHSWMGSSKYAYYEPLGGFEHWNLSAIAPSPILFQRLYKIPSPFHSDFLGEFFEWLYMRRSP